MHRRYAGAPLGRAAMPAAGQRADRGAGAGTRLAAACGPPQAAKTAARQRSAVAGLRRRGRRRRGSARGAWSSGRCKQLRSAAQLS